MSKYILSLAVLLAIAPVITPAIAGQEDPQTQPTTATAKQVYCPVTPDQEIDPEIFTDYKGQRIYFCSNRCKVKFNRDPDQYIVRLVNIGATEPQAPGIAEQERAHEHQTTAPSASAPHEHGDTDDHDHQASGPADTHSGEMHNEHSDLARPGSPEHDHKEHGPGRGPRWLKWIGGFHPPMTNFPIGVLVAAALAEALFIRTRRSEFDHTARFGVIFAVATGIATGLLGWCFGDFRLSDPDKLLTIHRWLGTSTVLWLIILLWVSERAHRAPDAPRRLYRVLLFAGAALVLATGFFGGAMVYGLDHYLP